MSHPLQDQDGHWNAVDEQAQIALAGCQRFLGTFAVVDVYNAAEPLDDRARCISHGARTKQKPSICPVAAAQTRLCLPWLSGLERGAPAFEQSRMKNGPMPFGHSRWSSLRGDSPRARAVHRCLYSVKTKSLSLAIVWHATPHLASFACGGLSAVVAGVNVSVAVSYLNAP